MATHMEWLKRGLRRWFMQGDRRQCQRRRAPLVAFYWSGGRPNPSPVDNISCEGVFIVSQSQWGAGTVVDLVLQPASGSSDDPTGLSSLAVQAIIIWRNSRGMGLQFLFSDKRESKHFEEFLRTVEASVNE